MMCSSRRAGAQPGQGRRAECLFIVLDDTGFGYNTTKDVWTFALNTERSCDWSKSPRSVPLNFLRPN
jgi:hypothetical protein